MEDILKLIDDNERGRRDSAFSIQNVAVEALEFGKLPGSWYGVNTITNIVEILNEKYRPIEGFKVCVFSDGNFINEKVEKLAREIPQGIDLGESQGQ
jgi:hypothetical protein